MVIMSKPAASKAAVLAFLCALGPLTAQAACDPSGADHGVRRCAGGNCGTDIEICNWATSFIQAVAPGTLCYDGGLVLESDSRCAAPPTPGTESFTCPSPGMFCKAQCGATLVACASAGSSGTDMPVAPGTVCDNGGLAFASSCEPLTKVTISPDPTNPQVQSIFADAAAPVVDATNGGWRFINDAAGKKINWYLFPGAGSQVIPDKSVAAFDGMWVKFVRNSANGGETPWINLYTQPEASDNGASWYHTRVNYLSLYNDESQMPQGTTAVLYIGDMPQAADWTELDGSETYFDGSASGGELFRPSSRSVLADTEIVRLIAFSTNSGAAVNTIDYTMLSAGYSFGGQRTEIKTSN